MKQLTVKQRLRHYCILAFMVVTVPVAPAILSIIFTGNWAAGLGMATVPSLALIHILFGLLLFRTANNNTKYIALVAAAIIGTSIFWPIIMSLKIFGMFWLTVAEGYMAYIFASAVLWEMIYQAGYLLSQKMLA